MTNEKPASWRSKKIGVLVFVLLIIAIIFGYDKNNNFDIVQSIYFFIIIVLLVIIAFKAYQIFKVDTSNHEKGYHNQLLGLFLIVIVISAFLVSIVGLIFSQVNAYDWIGKGYALIGLGIFIVIGTTLVFNAGRKRVIKWKYATGSGVDSSPAVVNGVVYVGSGDGYLYAIE